MTHGKKKVVCNILVT